MVRSRPVFSMAANGGANMTKEKWRATMMRRGRRGDHCVGECAGGCLGGAVADLILHVRCRDGTTREIEEFPLCVSHSHDDRFLIWYTRFAHRLVLATARAVDPKSATEESAKEIRFMYWVSERPPQRYFVKAAANDTLVDLMRTPGITLSGAFGKSIVASSYRGKPYFRTYVVPRNPRTESQQRHRAFFKRALREWRGLSKPQRDFYDRFAEDMQLSGYNLFVSRCMKSLLAGIEPELPKLFRWTTPGRQPIPDAELRVLRGAKLLFKEGLERGMVELALTESDAPYTFLLKNGVREEPVPVTQTPSETGIPMVVEDVGLGIRLVVGEPIPPQESLPEDK